MKGYTNKGVFLTEEGKWLSEKEALSFVKEHLDNIFEDKTQDVNSQNSVYVFTILIIALITFLALAGADTLIVIVTSLLLIASAIVFFFYKKNKEPEEKKEVQILEHSYEEKIFSLFEVNENTRVLISHDNDYGISKEVSGTIFDNEDAIISEIKISHSYLEEYDKPILNSADKSKIYPDSEIYSFDIETKLRNSLNKIDTDLSSAKNITLSFPFVNDSSLIEFIEEYTEETDDLKINSKINSDDFETLESLLQHENRFKSELQVLINTLIERFELNVSHFSAYMEEMDNFRNKMVLFSIEAAYYTFCPKCNNDFFKQSDFADFQFNETAQTRYDYKSDSWVCVSCKHKTDRPIPVPKIYQELIQPVVRQLLMEHHTEREKLYNDIENQKIGYIEKYRKEIREINRLNSSETEKIMTSIANLEAELEADKENLEFFQELVEKQRSELNSSLSSIDNAFQKIRVDTERATEISISEMSSEMNAIWMNAEKTFNNLAQIQRVADQRRDQQFQTIVENSVKQTELAEEANSHLGNISENTAKTAKSVEHIATITQAEADRKGYDKSKNIGHKFKKLKNRVTTAVTGGSDLDRAKKDMKG